MKKLIFLLFSISAAFTAQSQTKTGAPGHPFYDHYTEPALSWNDVYAFVKTGAHQERWFIGQDEFKEDLIHNIEVYNSEYDLGYETLDTSYLPSFVKNAEVRTIGEVAALFPNGLENSYVDKATGAIIYYPISPADNLRKVYCLIRNGKTLPQYLYDCGNLVRVNMSSPSAKQNQSGTTTSSTTTTTPNGTTIINNYTTVNSTSTSSGGNVTSSDRQERENHSAQEGFFQNPQPQQFYLPNQQVVYATPMPQQQIQEKQNNGLLYFLAGAVVGAVAYELYEDRRGGYYSCPQQQQYVPQYIPPRAPTGGFVDINTGYPNTNTGGGFFDINTGFPH